MSQYAFIPMQSMKIIKLKNLWNSINGFHIGMNVNIGAQQL